MKTKAAIYSKRYQLRHPEQYRAGLKKYRISHQDECQKRTAEWKKEHPEKVHLYYLKNYPKTKLKRQLEGYHHSEKVTLWRKKHRNEFPEKEIARNRANQAVIYGRLKIEKQCSGCKKVAKLQKHHSDYSKPLQVKWLCPSCHKRLHIGRL
jgi:hypothetical protein